MAPWLIYLKKKISKVYRLAKIIILIHLLFLAEITLVPQVILFLNAHGFIGKEAEQVNSGRVIDKLSIVKACIFNGGCVDNVLLFSAKINESNVELLSQYLLDNPHIKMICLRSSGGLSKQSGLMLNVIVNRGVATCIADYYEMADGFIIKDSYCISACNLPFLAAKKRVQLGVSNTFAGHSSAYTSDLSWDLGAVSWLITNSIKYENRDYIWKLDYSNTEDKEFHKLYFNAVNSIGHLDKIKVLTEDEINRYKIFTHRCVKAESCP